MDIIINKYERSDAEGVTAVWNEIVEGGIAFPQTEMLTAESGNDFFLSQTYTGVAKNAANGEIVGLYILHPNNVGRCGHISNASYAVKATARGNKIGEALVKDCLAKAPAFGYKILQFNAVVATNTPALNLYKKLGFTKLGVIPNGFLLPDGTYADIIPHYIELI